MNAATLEAALSELRDASEELWDALRNRELEKLVDALAQRESAFQTVVRAAGPASPCARALLAEVQSRDGDALRDAIDPRLRNV